MDMRELPDVLEIFKLTGEQYARIAATEFFQLTLALARIEWTSAVNTAERIKIEAAAALEDALPALSARMSDSYENLTAAVEAGKLFAKLAGLGERDASGGHAGEKFTININLGEGQEIKFEKDVTPTSAGALSVDTKGEGHTSPV
jgi:hypothetical protein